MKRCWAIIAVALIAMAFSGCQTATVAPTATPEATVAATAEATATAEPEEKAEPITVTAFSPLSGDATAYGFYENLAETPTAKYFAEKTGVNVVYTHPVSGQETEQLNLLISSGDLPDIVVDYMTRYKGGIEAAIQEGIILDVEDLVMQYAPNFKKAVLDNPDAKKLAYNDNGVLTGFGAYYSIEYGYDEGLPYSGLFIRRDLLKKLNLEMPHTIDEYTAVLRAFKADGISVPFAYSASGWNVLQGSHAIASAFDTAASGFYQKEGEVFYSKMQPGYAQYLAVLHQWYKEGLMDQDFMTHTFVDHTLPMMADGTSAMGTVHLYLWINTHDAALEKGYDFGPAPMPVATEGQKLSISDDWGFFGGNSLSKCISSESKFAKEIVQMYDFLYSEEGKVLTNWGIEGESYELGSDGLPQLNDAMKEDLYRLNVVYCPNELNQLGDKEHDLIQYQLDVHKEAWTMWRDNVTAEWRMPPGISLTAEEDTKRADIMTEIETYADEMILKFILGDADLDTFNDYVAEIESMGIQDVLDIYKAAIVRYNKR